MAKVLAATKSKNYFANYENAEDWDILEYKHKRKFFNNFISIGDEVWIRVQGNNHVMLKGEITNIKNNIFWFRKIESCDISTKEMFSGEKGRPLKAGAEFGWIERT